MSTEFIQKVLQGKQILSGLQRDNYLNSSHSKNQINNKYICNCYRRYSMLFNATANVPTNVPTLDNNLYSRVGQTTTVI